MQDRKFASYTIIALTGIYPLWVLGGYNYILQSRFLFLGFVIAAMFWGLLMLRLLAPDKQRNRLDVVDIGVIAFLVCCILSIIFSGRECKALVLGYASDGMGLFWYGMMGMLYYVLRRAWRPSRSQMTVVFLAGIIVTLLAVVQFLGLDLLYLMPKNPLTTHPGNFLSTFGNTGLFAVYLSLLFPFALGLWCLTDNSKMHGIALIIVCYCGVFCANSDIAYLGLAVAFIAYFMITLIKRTGFLRLFAVGSLFPVSGLLFGLLYRIFSESARPLSRISRFFLFWYEKKEGIPTIVEAGNTTVIATGFAAAPADKMEAAKDAILQLIESTSAVSSDYFGNGRGYIWSRLLNVFSENTLLHKLFGNGVGSVPYVIEENFGAEMRTLMSDIFTDAHSEPINHLTTVGLLGLIALLTACAGVFLPKKSGENAEDSPQAGVRTILTVVFVSYLVVSTVSLTQPITGVFFWMLLGMMDSVRPIRARIVQDNHS